MEWQDYIVSDKGILLGKPSIKGTRLSVDHLVGLLAQGWFIYNSAEKIILVKLLANENFPIAGIRLLRNKGYDIS